MLSPFSGAELHSANKPSAFLEMAFSLQASELSVPEETRPNNVTISIDAETGIASVTATLPVAIVLDAAGKPVVTATDYLP